MNAMTRGIGAMTDWNRNFDELMGDNNIHEYREITVTSKRQITIPKSFFDYLGIEDSLVAWLTDDGIYLKPVHSQNSVYDLDRREIILGALSEGGSQDELAERIGRRLEEYDELMSRRIREFQSDVSGSSDKEDSEFNGLNVTHTASAGPGPTV